MQIFKSYKDLPRKGEVVRLYEFRGRHCAHSQELENAEPSVFSSARLRNFLVLAEDLPDAVAHVQRHLPLFSPDRVLYLARIQPAKATVDAGGSSEEELRHFRK